jgi:hypothetical protein
MALGSYEDHLQVEIQRQAPSLLLDQLKVTFLAGPDKSDPLNLRAVMCAEAYIGGRSCAWSVEGENGKSSATGARLLKVLASVIVAKPDQERGQARGNVGKLD